MAIPETIPSPEFVELGAKDAGGLDLLGLRLPVQTIGNAILNGVTTITPTVRYLSFRTWLLYRYVTADPAPEDRSAAFAKYARRAECAFVLANLLRDRSTVGLIGSQKGSRKLDEEGDVIIMEPLAKQPAVSIYSRPSDQLRLTRSRDPYVPIIGEEHGEPLALAMEMAVGGTAIAEQLESPEPLEVAAVDDLEEFGQAAWVNDIPADEREQLIRAILPEAPQEDDRPRLATYAILISLADLHQSSVQEDRFFEEAVRPDRRIPSPLHDTLDGWLLYAIRDAMAVTGEYSLAAINDKLRGEDPAGGGIPDTRVVRRLVEDSAGEQVSALRDTGLGDGKESLTTLRFLELEERVRDQTPEVRTHRGIRRWDTALTEPLVYGLARGAKDGALVLGVLSWILADRRAAVDGGRTDPRIRLLSHQGTSRFGLEQVVVPQLERWRAQDPPLAAVLSEYAHQVIEQHLRIVWSRLAQDPTRDVAIFHRDRDRLIRGADYGGGRTASRISQAISWLEQLGLIDASGATSDGRQVLERALRSLE